MKETQIHTPTPTQRSTYCTCMYVEFLSFEAITPMMHIKISISAITQIMATTAKLSLKLSTPSADP